MSALTSSPSPSPVTPAVLDACIPDARSFNTMLITPAIASEPYWAAAPSRSTSIRSIAAAGIAFRSTPTVPRPNVPERLSSQLVQTLAQWRG